MSEHDVAKALEVWTLQNLLNISLMLGLLATGLALIPQYCRAVERRLTLRVSIELWQAFTLAIVDVLLAIVVLVGYLVLNPDIMADIKMAVPFVPIATLLYAVALCLRLFHGGHEQGSPNFFRALYLMLVAGVLNVVGFTFVMEAPSGEYLATHPSPFWNYVKSHLRSNADPAGLELSQLTFTICFPLLLVILGWGVWSGLRQLRGASKE